MSPAKSVIFKGTIGLFLVLAAGCLVFLAFFPPYPLAEDGDLPPYVQSYYTFKQLALAMHDYHAAHGRFPPAATRDKNGRPLHSWRVLLLPFLEKDDLYKQFKLDEPWDSPHNKQLLAQMPYCYRDPSLHGPADKTFYQVFVGPGTAFEGDGQAVKDFPDGLSDTLLVVEASESVPWTQPKDLTYDPGKPLPALGGRFTPTVRWLGCLSRKQPIALACLANGRAIWLRFPLPEKTLRGLITRNGGEEIDWSRLE